MYFCYCASYPYCIDLRAILKEIPDTWPELLPQISELFEVSHGAECAVCLKQRRKTFKKTIKKYLTIQLSHLSLTESIPAEPLLFALSQSRHESTPHLHISANPWRDSSHCNTATPHGDECKWGYLPLNIDL